MSTASRSTPLVFQGIDALLAIFERITFRLCDIHGMGRLRPRCNICGVVNTLGVCIVFGVGGPDDVVLGRGIVTRGC